MAIGKQGNSYTINAASNASLPFAAPKKTNSKALDTFNKKKTPEAPKTVTVEEIQKETAPVQEIPTETVVLTHLSTSETITEPEKKEEPIPKRERFYKNSSEKLNAYTGVRKNTTFAFCDSNDISYIKIKANRLGITYQDFLAEILLDNIETINSDAFDYTEETYQNTKRGLKNPVNDRFALKEDFLLDVKQAAANVGMKRSAFVAMCVHKARLSDPNPAWDI